MPNEKERPGEGDRESDRHYRQHTKEFVESGEVDEKARQATPSSKEEAEALEKAEEAGKERAKEKDPAVKRDYSKSS